MQPWPGTQLTGTRPWSATCAQQPASPKSKQEQLLPSDLLEGAVQQIYNCLAPSQSLSISIIIGTVCAAHEL